MNRILLFSVLTFAGTLLAEEAQQPAAGSLARKAILDGLRQDEVVRQLAAEWKAKVIFTHVAIRQVGEWAWLVASPQTEDEKHIIEPLTSVMHGPGGRWKVVEYISDEVAPADDPEQAYQKWRAEFMKRHRECPFQIFPAKFD